MRLGLIADIHESVEYLRTAIDRFAAERVDRIVVLGDVFETGDRLEETCRLLSDAGAVGVWGNHDYRFCIDKSDEFLLEYPDVVREFMGSLHPRLSIDDCHFTHVEPWLNPLRIEDLWYFDGPPHEHGKLDRIFRSVPERLLFAGHFHRWLVAQPSQFDHWDGRNAIRLATGRFFVVINALCEGYYAIIDTSTSELIPFAERRIEREFEEPS